MTARIATTGLLALLLATGAAASDFEKTVPAESGGELRIDLDVGSVEVESHAENSVRVEAWAAGMGSRGARFDLSSDGDNVRFSGEVGGWLSVLGGPRVRVRVRVPREFSLELETNGGHVEIEDLHGDVRARTSGGTVRVDRIEGDVDLETSGGSIEVDDVEGEITARTSGGSIRVSEARGDVEVQTSGGSIQIRDVEGRVNARTSGGSITVRFASDPAGNLETSGGGIEVELPDGEGVFLDAQTRGGRIELPQRLRFEGSRTSDTVRGDAGGGGDDLTLRTSGGNIRIEQR
jgi:DUF4097 and DUF4098 domain-containing protein YvlB